ncbi:hypothetical protein A2U01_0078531, partial [Trifolium medium]|nr:hypothetical protein [Trifolium medium]
MLSALLTIVDAVTSLILNPINLNSKKDYTHS